MRSWTSVCSVTISFNIVTPDCRLVHAWSLGSTTYSVFLTHGCSKTLFNAVFIRPQQVVRFWLCTRCWFIYFNGFVSSQHWVCHFASMYTTFTVSLFSSVMLLWFRESHLISWACGPVPCKRGLRSCFQALHNVLELPNTNGTKNLSPFQKWGN